MDQFWTIESRVFIVVLVQIRTFNLGQMSHSLSKGIKQSVIQWPDNGHMFNILSRTFISYKIF